MGLSVLQYCYNTLLIIAYTSVIAFACCMTLLRRQEFGIPVIGLFLFFLLDTIVIDLTEFNSEFSAWYNQMFVSTPSIKTVIYLGIAFFSMYFYSAMKGRPIGPFHGAVVLLLGLWYIFLPMLKIGAVESFLYYTAYQVFALCACIYALWDIPRCGAFTENHQKLLKTIIIVTIVFSVLIVIEDAWVIFFVDDYTEANLDIYERNRCEDFLRLAYTAIFYVLFARVFRTGWMTLPGDILNGRKDGADGGDVSNEADSVLVPAPAFSEKREEEYKKLKFSRQLGLTGRELEVFSLLLEGMDNQRIADTLVVSMGTVKAHVHNIYKKADVTRRYELIRLYEAFEPGAEG